MNNTLPRDEDFGCGWIVREGGCLWLDIYKNQSTFSNLFRSAKVPPKSIIFVIEPCVTHKGYVKVLWNGRFAMVHVHVLQARCEPLP